MEQPTIIVVERQGDPRGWSATPTSEPNRQSAAYDLHVVSLKPGSTRGNHYHQAHTESIFCLGGVFRFHYATGSSAQVMSLTLGPEPTLIIVPAGLIHAVSNEAEQELVFICYSDRPVFGKDQVQVVIR